MPKVPLYSFPKRGVLYIIYTAIITAVGCDAANRRQAATLTLWHYESCERTRAKWPLSKTTVHLMANPNPAAADYTGIWKLSAKVFLRVFLSQSVFFTSECHSSAAAKAEKVFKRWRCKRPTASLIASLNGSVLPVLRFTSISSIPSTSLLQLQLSVALRTFAARLAALPSWHIISVSSKAM